MILPPNLILLVTLAFGQICQPVDMRSGYFTYYNKSPTDGTIAYHQRESGKLPEDLSAYVGVIAVRNCNLVGDDAWIRMTDTRTNERYANTWLPVKVFDCSGHVETTEWMDENNILGELGYYLANDLGLYGETQIRGDMILEAPASVEHVCEPEPATATMTPDTGGTLTIPQILTLDAIEEIPTEAPTVTPTSTPLPTAAVVFRKVTSSARAIAFAATPTPIPEPAMVEVPILNVQGSDTVINSLENLPLILAALILILWLCLGVLMFLFGFLVGSRRSVERSDDILSEMASLANSLRTQPHIQLKQSSDRPDGES